MKRNLVLKLSPAILLLLFIACKSSNKVGQTNMGADRKVVTATSVATCTHPSKRYAKSLEVAVKASFDSLVGLPLNSIDASLKNTITHLSDYSSEGLDFDLLNFRMCEFANSAGLSEAAKEGIIKKVYDTWQTLMLQKQQKSGTTLNVNQSGGISAPINVTSNYQSGGVTAGVVVVPEDKEVPINENYSIGLVNDPDILKRYPNKIIIAAQPKQGNWYLPMLGFPINEETTCGCKFSASLTTGFILMNSITTSGVYHTQKDSINYRVLAGTDGAPAKNDKAYYLICDKMPSSFFIGDFSNKEKQYVLFPNK